MNKKGTVRRLIKDMTSQYKVALIFVFVFIIISTVANIASSFFIQSLIDTYIPNIVTGENEAFANLLKLIIIMAIIYGAGIIATFFYNRMMVTVSQGVQKSIREKLFAHMQSLPIRYFDTHTHGNIMSRYTNDIDTLREFFSQSLPNLVSSAFTIMFAIVAMLIINPTLTLIVAVFTVAIIIVSKTLGFKAAKLNRQQQRVIGEMNGYIKETIHGQKVVKVFCHEKEVIQEFDGLNTELQTYSRKANQFANMLMPIIMNIGAYQYVAIAIIGGILALNNIGNVQLGDIVAFVTLSKTFSSPFAQISAQFNAMTMAFAGAERIYNLMDEEPEVDDGYVTLTNIRYENDTLVETNDNTGLWAWKHPHQDGTTTYTELKGDVRFYDVDFGYVPNKLVLHDISLYAEPGQKIAFVGATGAGKTTITNLINRFYDIADGKIRYDDININKIKKADLRRSLGIVLQDTHLFSGSIADNIRYGKLNATKDEIQKAALIANADDFIQRLPNGYDTVLSGDGGNLSSGQRQLIAIARAAVADPPVMIMDEATSSIDTRTEMLVQNGMDALMSGRTVFVIAHRLSTIKNAEAIMVMENGRIIERGNHEDLIEQKGRYYQLYTGKFD